MINGMIILRIGTKKSKAESGGARMKQKLINELLAAQIALARALSVGRQSGDATDILSAQDSAELRAMLIVIPGIVARVEN